MRNTIRGTAADRPGMMPRSVAKPYAYFIHMLLLLVVTACDASFEATGPTDGLDLSQAALEIVSGDGQEAQVAGMAPEALVVRLVDNEGAPIPGVTLEWTFTQGRGHSPKASGVASEVVTDETDADGLSEVTWQLGTTAGRQEVEVGILITDDPPTPPSGVGGAPRWRSRWSKWVGFWGRAWAAAPAEVVVTPEVVTGQPDDAVQLSADVTDQYGNAVEDANVSWLSSNTSVARVSNSGLVTMLAAGSAEVSAEAGSAEGLADVTVEPLPTPGPSDPGTVSDLRIVETTETSVTLRWTQVTDGDGGAAEYALRTATPTLAWADAYASEVTVAGTALGQSIDYTWSGLASGATHQFRLVAFRGQLGNGAVFGGLSNTVSGTTDSDAAIIAEVVVSPEGVTLVEGESANFSAVALDEGGAEIGGATFSWRSSDSSVLTVDAAGHVSAVAAGSANVIATTDGIEGSQGVTVEAAPEPNPASPGRVTDLQVVSATESGLRLRWTQVSDGSGGAADYAVRLGSPSIAWGEASSTEIVVDGTDIAATIEHEWPDLEAGTEYEFQLVAFRGELGIDAEFGELSNVATGTTDGPEVAAVIASPETVTLAGVGETATLSVHAEDETGSQMSGIDFEFSSSDPTTVQVDDMGRLTAQSTGVAIITVAAVCCTASDSITVVVEGDTLTVESVVFQDGETSAELSQLSLEIGDVVDLEAAAQDAQGDIIDGLTITWSSSNPSVALVSPQGVVQALTEGLTDIRASVEGFTATLPTQVYAPASTLGLIAQDGFESGNLSHQENGFRWTNSGEENGQVGVSSTVQRSGSNALRFRFNGVSGGSDSWVEQRFSYSRMDYEAWVEYYIYIPANYRHRNESDTEHHKFYSLWGVNYTGSGRPKTVLELWRVDDNTSEFRFVQNLAGQSSSMQHGQLRTAISPSGPMRKGQWHRIRIYQHTGTPGADNAAFRLMVDDQVIFDFNDIPNQNSGGRFYWDGGYLMGYTNGGFSETTDFYIDDFRIYDSNPGWW